MHHRPNRHLSLRYVIRVLHKCKLGVQILDHPPQEWRENKKNRQDAPASLMAALISTRVTLAFNRRSKVDKLSLEYFRRPMTFRVEFPDCIKPFKSTPICCSFVELYSGSEEREEPENGKGGRGGEEDRPSIWEARRERGETCWVSGLFLVSLMHFSKLAWACDSIVLSPGG